MFGSGIVASLSVNCEKLVRHKKRQHGNRVVPQRRHRVTGFEILERRIVLSNSVPLAPAITEPLLDGHVVNSSDVHLEAGPTYATGPQNDSKVITEFELDAVGNLISGPTELVKYNGAGKASIGGLVAGPDGLYFTDLYKDLNPSSPIEAGANVLSVQFVGLVDFTSDQTTGLAPLTVQFTDASDVPGATAWLWNFGDGSTSTEQNPIRDYTSNGVYDVTLRTTGANGIVTERKDDFIQIGESAPIGLSATYFDSIDLTSPTVTRIDSTVDFDWGSGSPDPLVGPNTFSARWTGQMVADFSEIYTLYTQSDNGARLWVNGVSVIDNWTNHSVTEDSATITLIAGQKNVIRMEFYEKDGVAVASLLWSSPSTPKQVIPQSNLLSLTDQINHVPYLQLGDAPLVTFPGSTTDQVQVLWQTISDGAESSDNFSIEYRAVGATTWNPAGPVTAIDTGVGERVNQYADITGLDFDADYQYRVQHLRGGSVIDTYQNSFHTRLPPGDATPFSFAAYGDSAYTPAIQNFRDVQARINQLEPAFALLLGDNVYNSGTHVELDARFDHILNPETAEWISSHIDYVSFGNHDVATAGGQASEDNFAVPVPVAGVTAPAEPDPAETPEHNYSFDYGDVHFVTFDTNSLHNAVRLNAQLDWVEQDLAESSAQWKIVFGHHPVAGVPDKPESPADNYYQQVVPRLRAAGVDLLLVGHSHTYSWTYPLLGEQNNNATFILDTDKDYNKGAGLVQVVSGVGGKSLRSGDYDQFPFIASGSTTDTNPSLEFGIAVIDVTPTQLTVSYVAADDGATLDQFTITSGVDTTPPAASLSTPQDNGPSDLDPAVNAVNVTSTQPVFDIRLSDISGVDDTTVTLATVSLTKDAVPLAESTDYSFGYNAATDVIILTSIGGDFDDGVYVATLSGGAATIDDTVGNTMSFTPLTVEIDTLIQVVSFQQGVGGYTSTVDTMLQEASPSVNNSAAVSLNVDSDDPNSSGQAVQALLRFDSIFGGGGQIPTTATIQSATLELDVSNEGSAIDLHRMLSGWIDTDTWNSLTAGVSADGIEATTVADSATSAVSTGTLAIDVLSSLQAWQSNPSQNLGWAILPMGTNGVDFDSAEGTTSPRLEVQYASAPATSGITVTSISGNTTEAGGAATFTVVLDSPPTANVTIGLSSNDTSEGTVSPASLTFTPANWSIAQTVKVTGVDDLVDDGDVGYTIVTAAAASGDANYSGLDADDVAVTNQDDDVPSVVVFYFSLGSNDTGNVLGLDGGYARNEDLVSFDGSAFSMAFDGSDLGVTGNMDAVAVISETEILFSLTSGATLPGIAGRVDDSDIVLFTATQLGENTAGSLSLYFDGSDVDLTTNGEDTDGIELLDGGDLLISTRGSVSVMGASGADEDFLRFTPTSLGPTTAGTWSVYFDGSDVGLSSSGSEDVDAAALDASGKIYLSTLGKFSVTGMSGADEDMFVFTPATLGTSTTGAFDPTLFFNASVYGLGANDLYAFDLTPIAAGDGVTIAESGGSTDVAEGGAGDSYTVVLDSQPMADVTVTVSPDGQLNASPANLTFTPANWNTPQTVTVIAVDDLANESTPHLGTIAHAAASGDGDYNRISIDDVTANITDNDMASGITVSPTAGLVTTETGGADTFTIVLDAQPTDNVTIGLSSSDTSEGTVLPASVTFTPANWSTAQTVTVTGVNDLVDDENVGYTVVTDSATSSDANYNGLNAANVSVTNTDNNVADITVSPISGLVTTEVGGTDTFSVMLDSQPTANVTIGLSSSNTAEGTVSPVSLTFTPASWNSSQIVTVTGVDDAVSDGDAAYTIVTAAGTSGDANYNGLDADDVAVTNQDDEVSTVALYFSLGSNDNGNVLGLSGGAARNEDIVSFDGNTFSMMFDGSDVGVTGNVDAIAVISETEILFSLTLGATLPGISGTVDDSDIVLFTATQLGENTDGTLSLYFDGSDVKLTTNGEDTDGIELLDDGDLLISTRGSVSVKGALGADEDLFRFTPTSLGTTTAGTWSKYFDGSDVGLSSSNSEDVDALAVDVDGKIYLSTVRNFSVTGVSGADEDIFVFTPATLGTSTTGAYDSTLFFDASIYGLSANDLSAIDLPLPSSIASLAPGQLLVYYAWPSGINGAASNGAAAAEFGQYDYVVLGDGLEKVTHGDHNNVVSMIADPAAANAVFYGYIDLGVSTQNLPLAEIQTRIDEWQQTGADGIFMDDFGYDFGVTRDRQNAAVDYAHSLGMPVVTNAWDASDAFSSDVHANNSTGTATSLGAADFYLSESYQIIVRPRATR